MASAEDPQRHTAAERRAALGPPQQPPPSSSPSSSQQQPGDAAAAAAAAAATSAAQESNPGGAWPSSSATLSGASNSSPLIDRQGAFDGSLGSLGKHPPSPSRSPWGSMMSAGGLTVSTPGSESLHTPMTPANLARPFELGALADAHAVAFTQSPSAMSPAQWTTHRQLPLRKPPPRPPPLQPVKSGAAAADGGDKRSVGITDKHRPSPLDITRTDDIDVEAPLTGASTGSAHSTLSDDLLDLSTLRQSVHQNLRDRPLNHVCADGDEESLCSSGLVSPVEPSISFNRNNNNNNNNNNTSSISPTETLALYRTSEQLLIIDVRPLDSFQEAHLPSAVSLSVPATRLYRDTLDGRPPTWADFLPFLNTMASQVMWQTIDLTNHIDVVISGVDGRDQHPQSLATVLTPMLNASTVGVLAGGWAAIAEQARAAGLFELGQIAPPPPPSTDSPMSVCTSTPTQAATIIPPGRSPPISPMLPSPLNPTDAPAPSQTGVRTVSQLRAVSPRRRPLPSLSIHPGPTSPGRRAPKLHLNLDSAKVGGKNIMVPPPQRSARPKPGLLTIDVGVSRLSPGSPGSSAGMGPTPRVSGTQFGDSSQPHLLTPIPASGVYPTHPTSPGLLLPLAAPPARVPTPIEISTILPSFLYLGPEITTTADVEELLTLGVRRILNVAIECDDDEGLDLRTKFERYHRIPMKDTVEESGVGPGIREACRLIDDARLHSAPVYVHCKAGKSRSVTAVLAYLIHANAWTLQTSYQYVSQRRRGISPNIGFVAELMEFESAELGHKQSAGPHGEADTSKSHNSAGAAEDDEPPVIMREPRVGPRYTRESLPPEFGSERLVEDEASPVEEPLPDHTPEGGNRLRRVSQADIEVRKNGQWVHKRAPVDRTTLQPGRRVSKAGLESMMMRPLARTDE